MHSDSDALVLGTYRDVFCKKNKIYYEAQVKRLKEPKKPGDKLKILFHFKGWSPKFDEWIEAGSDRIRYVLTHTYRRGFSRIISSQYSVQPSVLSEYGSL